MKGNIPTTRQDSAKKGSIARIKIQNIIKIGKSQS